MGERGRWLGVPTGVTVAALALAVVIALMLAWGRYAWANDGGLPSVVLGEINAARTDPAAYADKLKGPGAEEARDFLRRQAPMAPLTHDPRLDAVAAAHVAEQGPQGGFSHTGANGSTPRLRIQGAGVWAMVFAEEISLSEDTAAGVVRQLIIDSTSPTRAHRGDLFDPKLKFAGVGCGRNAKWTVMCVIDMTGPQLPPPGSERGPQVASGTGGAAVTPQTVRGDVAAVGASSVATAPSCPYPSGKISSHMVDAEVYSALLYGTSDTFTDSADMLRQLKAKVAPHYDPNGVCGRCIEQLDVWGHGDTGGGYISFGPNDAQVGNMALGDLQQNLSGVAALMCKGGKVVINQCNAGKGNKGAQALQALADLLGVPVSGPTDKIKGCRIFGGAFTGYDEKQPGPGAKTPDQRSAGPVSTP